MKKLMLLSLVLGMFVFSSCDSKRAYCDCVNSAMELMEKVQSGEMTEADADAELANCKWMEDLSEDESAAELKKCTEGAAGDMAKGINELQELSEGLEEVAEDFEDEDYSLDEYDEEMDELVEDFEDEMNDIIEDYEDDLDELEEEIEGM
jgi:peptidoglycan hydrolase CwlO-like protein